MILRHDAVNALAADSFDQLTIESRQYGRSRLRSKPTTPGRPGCCTSMLYAYRAANRTLPERRRLSTLAVNRVRLRKEPITNRIKLLVPGLDRLAPGVVRMLCAKVSH